MLPIPRFCLTFITTSQPPASTFSCLLLGLADISGLRPKSPPIACTSTFRLCLLHHSSEHLLQSHHLQRHHSEGRRRQVQGKYQTDVMETTKTSLKSGKYTTASMAPCLLNTSALMLVTEEEKSCLSGLMSLSEPNYNSP